MVVIAGDSPTIVSFGILFYLTRISSLYYNCYAYHSVGFCILDSINKLILYLFNLIHNLINLFKLNINATFIYIPLYIYLIFMALIKYKQINIYFDQIINS